MRYVPRFDGVGFEVESGKVTRWACCDCGLVHDIAFVTQDGKPVDVAAQVNRRATAARRRSRPEATTSEPAAIAKVEGWP